MEIPEKNKVGGEKNIDYPATKLPPDEMKPLSFTPNSLQGASNGVSGVINFQEEEFPKGPAEEAPLKYPLPEGVYYAGAKSAKELAEGDITQLEGFNLINSTIHYFAVKDAEGGIEFIGFVDYDLRGLRLNRLLLAIAPFKDFGLDTDDILMDWGDINNNARRLNNHSQIPGWDTFMAEMPFLRERIQEGKNESNSPQIGIVPIIRWKIDAGGKKHWIFDHFEGEPYDTIVGAYLSGAAAKTDRSNAAWLSPLVGLYAVAYFSPSIISKWPSRLGYSSASPSKNLMGPTQVGALALMKTEELIKSAFISNSEQFIIGSITE